MYIPPKALSVTKLPSEILKVDKKYCSHIGDAGLGDKALYVEHLACPRMGYIPLSAIDRVYKRLAVSKGAFEGNVFGTLSYLVVRFEGKDKAFRFTHEEHVDELLNAFREKTRIPVGKA